MRIAISITKKVSFRSVQQEFSNVYHYELMGAATGPWEALADEIKDAEVNWHASDVTFVRAHVWSAGGTPSQNVMLFQKPLTGTGMQQAIGNMDRERAVLIQWPAGVDSRGKPVYLRKWYHSCGNVHSETFTVANLQNTTPISEATRTVLANQATAFDEVGVAEAWNLCAASGRVPTGPPVAHKWLEHHQLGDAWR